MSILNKLKSLDINLPAPTAALGAYVPAKRVGNLVYVSGQLPMKDGKLLATGPIPSKCSADDAKLAMRQCVVNALAAVNALSGGVEAIRSVVRIGAFVSSDSSFTQQPAIANGASEFLIEIFGDSGRHVRAAVGVNVLPLDASVEVEFLFEMNNA